MLDTKEMFQTWPEVSIWSILEKNNLKTFDEKFTQYCLTEEPTNRPTHIVPESYDGRISKENQLSYRHLKTVEIEDNKIKFEAAVIKRDNQDVGVGIYAEVLSGGRGAVLYPAEKILAKPPENNGLTIVDFLLELY
jgi:hypothetical protein